MSHQGSPQLEGGYTRIANELLDALCRTRIPGEERQVLDTILRKTYGYGKRTDCISLSQFESSTGLSRSAVCRAIKGLELKNIISLKKETSKITTYEIHKYFNKWRVVSKASRLNIESDESEKTAVTLSRHTIENLQKKEIAHTPLRTRVPKSDHALFTSWWCHAFLNCEGYQYQYNSKDAGIVKSLLGTDVDVKTLVRQACRFFLSNDEFYRGKKTLGMFSSTINQMPPIGAAEFPECRSRFIMPPDGVLFENWKFWEISDEANNSAAVN